MTHVIRIDVDGTLTRLDHRLVLDAAKTEYESRDVVVLNHPQLGRGQFVGVVSDWGRLDQLPINWKAWALYGRSVICGAMFVARDDRQPIDEQTIEWIDQYTFDELRPAMDAWLAENPAHDPTITISAIDPTTGAVISSETKPARRP